MHSQLNIKWNTVYKTLWAVNCFIVVIHMLVFPLYLYDGLVILRKEKNKTAWSWYRSIETCRNAYDIYYIML